MSKSSSHFEFNRTSLPNGVVVATQKIPSVRSASIGAYFDIGSRDESAKLNGISHFFEHMVFKGTKQRSALDIVKGFEATGGQVNAFTSKENTCLYAKVVDSDSEMALNTLLDMALNAKLDESDIKKEREVIVEEIKGSEDNPEDHVWDLFAQALYGEHGLGRPIAGTVKGMKELGRKELLEHQHKVRARSPFNVVAVGNVDHKEVVEGTAKSFGLEASVIKSLVKGTKLPVNERHAAVRPSAPKKAVHEVLQRKVQQANVVLGCPAFGVESPDRYPLVVLNCLMGEGMSSRLFQRIREEMGLVYSVYSNMETFVKGGCFSVAFATDPGNMEKAVRAAASELKLAREKGINAEELDFAKKNIVGNVLLGLESTYTRMGHLGRLLLLGKHGQPLDQSIKALEAVTRADVNRVARKLFDPSQWSSAAIVPKSTKSQISRWLGN